MKKMNGSQKPCSASSGESDLKHCRSCSTPSSKPKPQEEEDNKENNNNANGNASSSSLPKSKSLSLPLSVSTNRDRDRITLKPSSLQFCMQIHDPIPLDSHFSTSSLNIWDYSDSDAAPASSWSTLPNKFVLFCSSLSA